MHTLSVQQMRTLVRWRRWLTSRSVQFASSVWDATRRESRETKEALRILSLMLQQKPVSDVEKQLLVAQSKDLVKIVPLVALQGLPVPIPITPLLVIVASRYKLNILPGDQSALMAQIQGLPEGPPAATPEVPAAVPEKNEAP
jgi:hypothetical protein